MVGEMKCIADVSENTKHERQGKSAKFHFLPGLGQYYFSQQRQRCDGAGIGQRKT